MPENGAKVDVQLAINLKLYNWKCELWRIFNAQINQKRDKSTHKNSIRFYR